MTDEAYREWEALARKHNWGEAAEAINGLIAHLRKHTEDRTDASLLGAAMAMWSISVSLRQLAENNKG